MKFLGCIWYEPKFGKEKGNLEELSKKVKIMSEILARLVLRNNTWGNLTTSRLWQQSSVEFGETKSQCWAREIRAQIKMDTLRRRSRNFLTVLAVTGKVKKTRTQEFLFTISIFWLQCGYSMKLQRFYFFKYFAQNTDIHFSGQSAKLHDWPIMGSQLLVQWTTSYFLSYQDCHLFQEQFVLNIEINGSVQLFQKIETIYQIQSRLEVTSMHAGNRCWQMLTDPDKQATGNCEPAYVKVFQTRCIRRMQRKAFLIGYSPSQLI